MSRAPSGVIRVVRAWRCLSHEHRLAAGAAAALFVTLFFPWYHETVVTARQARSVPVTGWGAFSLVEGMVLLVAVGVLALLFRRAEGRGLRLPAVEGGLIAAAGAIAAVLVVVRMFDQPTAPLRGGGVAISGIEWGIFIALAVASFLAYAGNRIRMQTGSRSDEEQPTGSFEPVKPVVPAAVPRVTRRARPRRRYGAAEQLTIPLEERDLD